MNDTPAPAPSPTPSAVPTADPDRAAPDAPAAAGATRRAVLGVGLAGLGAATLAACGPGGPRAGKQAGAADGGSRRLARLSAVPVGHTVVAAGPDGNPIAVTRTGPDTVVGHSAICTHAGCQVAPQGAQLACPCHGSVFAAATGAVLNGPAIDPLPAVKVTLEGGEVVLA